MLPLQTAIYGNHQDPAAQHQAAVVEVAAGHVLHRQLQQGHLLGGAGSVAGGSQPTAWKLGHCIRAMMDQGCQTAAILIGIVELDEKYLGAKPRFEHGLKHKRGRGTAKQCILIAVQRQGSVRATPVKSNRVRELSPLVNSWVSQQAHLMSDEYAAYRSIAKGSGAHTTVDHQSQEYARTWCATVLQSPSGL